MNDLNAELVAKLKEQDEFLRGISEAALSYAVVVGDDGPSHQMVAIDQKLVRVRKHNKAGIGATVLVHPMSGQIIDVSTAAIGAHIASVVGIIPGGLAEIEGPEGRSVVRLHPDIKDIASGSRVLLDQTKKAALSVLADPPPPPPRFEQTKWTDVAGCETAKLELKEMIQLIQGGNKMMEAYGLRVPRGVMLYGPPGNGKTLMGRACATELGGHFLYVKATEILSMWVGQSEETIRRIFATARTQKAESGKETVIFVDEADAILGKRGTRSAGGMETTIVPAFLTEMDGLERSSGVVILATNRPDTLDEAVIREGRIDKKIYVGPPTADEARDVLTIGMRDAPTHGNQWECVQAAIEEIKALQMQPSGAKLIAITHTARQLAARRDAKERQPRGITTDDMREAVRRAQ